LHAQPETRMGLTSSSGATPVLLCRRLLYASVSAPRSWSQDLGCSATQWLKLVCIVRLNRSVCPSVYGWDGDVTFGSMESKLHTWP